MAIDCFLVLSNNDHEFWLISGWWWIIVLIGQQWLALRFWQAYQIVSYKYIHNDQPSISTRISNHINNNQPPSTDSWSTQPMLIIVNKKPVEEKTSISAFGKLSGSDKSPVSTGNQRTWGNLNIQVSLPTTDRYWQWSTK